MTEIVAPHQIPAGLGAKDYGYQIIVQLHGKRQLLTWNGETYCPTTDNMLDFPKSGDVMTGEHWFAGKAEYVFSGAAAGWSPVPARESNDLSGNAKEIVDHPSHYTRGPKIKVRQQGSWNLVDRTLECIEVMRWMGDPRLADALKYIWRVAFGGKAYDNMTLEESKRADIKKARWYLQDWLDNPVEDDE